MGCGAMGVILKLRTKECNMKALKNEQRTRCEVWTRVMGYHRPVSEFNPGKKSEHAERQHFVERCESATAVVNH